MPKPPLKRKPYTVERLEKAALYYLERYSTSTAGLRRVLQRKVRRSETENGDAMVTQVVAKMQTLGVIDDKRFAEGRTASLTAKGASQRGIKAKLQQKGVNAEVIQDALTDHDETAAAETFAKRKRLGRFRVDYDPKDREQLRKDLGVMGRQGFSYRVSQQALTRIET